MKSKLIISLVVLAALVAGGAFFVMNKNTKTDKQPISSSSSKQPSAPTTIGNGLKLAAQTVGQMADCGAYNFSELTGVWGVPFVDTDINKVQQLSADGGKLYSCVYNQTDSGMGVTYSIEYREHVSVDRAKQDMNDVRSTEKYGDKTYYTKEDKAGVGDEAFFWARYRTDGSKEANQQMYIRKGNVVFLLSGVNLDGVTSDYKDKLLASYKLHYN